jgi:hypothetical protein
LDTPARCIGTQILPPPRGAPRATSGAPAFLGVRHAGSDPADELSVARRSLSDLLRKKRVEKKALSPEMRTLLDSFEPLHEHRDPQDGKRRSNQESQVSARR